jgi:hypothetical protein
MNEQYTTFSSSCYASSEGQWKEYWQEVRQAQDVMFDAVTAHNLEEMERILSTKEIHPDTAFTHKQTVLHMAAAEGDLRVAELMVRHGASLEARTSLGRTPLILAAIRNDLPMVACLLDLGAKVDAQDYDLNTALHHAAEQCFEEMTRLLLDRGADLTIKNREKNLPADCCSSIAVLELLESRSEGLSRNDYSRTVVGDVILSNSRADHVRKMLKLTKAADYSLVESCAEGPYRSPKAWSGAERLERAANSKIIIIDTDTIREVTLKDFDVHAVLGRGAFGEVYYVEHRGTGQPYAMKVLSKEKVLNNNLVRYANTEKNILKTIRHPFIVKLDYAFQDEDRLYMVLEYCSRGDLESLLTRRKKLPEE